ncbi:MAG: alpha-ketoglutarate-dependent dioxygenase AlkB [Rudaea sp.]
MDCWRQIELADADVRLATFCDGRAAQSWFDRLRAEIAWHRHRVKMFGRVHDAPRLSCWVGDAGAVYAYSRTRYEPLPWTPALDELRDAVSAICAHRFNAVLCNLYRDGRDCMGWHSDDEHELGENPVVASLSFGATRKFRLRHRRDPTQRASIDLESGSLLYLGGAIQSHYRHDLPRSACTLDARINLTFREILIAK